MIQVALKPPPLSRTQVRYQLCGGTPQPVTVLGAGHIACSLGLLRVQAGLYDKVCTASGHANGRTIRLYAITTSAPVYPNTLLHVVQQMQTVQHNTGSACSSPENREE